MAQFYRFSSKLNRIQSNPFLSSSFSGIRQNRSLSSISTRTSSLSGSVRLSTSARSRALTTKAGNDANNNTDNNSSNWTRWLPFVALVGVSFLAGRKTIAYAQDSDENEPKKKGVLDWFWDKYDELVNEIDASVEDFVHEMARDPNDPNADENDLPLPNKLMAPLPEGYQRPITLLINLNVMIKQYHTAQSGTSVNIRPGILYFLDRLKSSKKFEVVVYTDSDKMEVDHLVSLLDTKQKYFALRIFKDVHINVDGKRYLPMEHLGRRSEHVIIIDDAFRVPFEHVNNVLPLKKWDGYHKNASDLLDTLPFLLRLGRTPYKDVREVLGFFHQNRLYIPDEYRKMRDENVRKDAAEMLQRASYLVDVHRTVPENMILDELEGTLETRIQTLKDRIAAKERGVSQHDLRLERIKRHDELLHAAVVAQEEKARRYGEPLSELSRRMPGGENVKITRQVADLLLDDHKQNKDQQQQQHDQ